MKFQLKCKIFFQEINLEMLSAKCQPFHLGVMVLNISGIKLPGVLVEEIIFLFNIWGMPLV